MTLTEAREYFANDIFATKTCGIKIDEVGENYSKVSMTVDGRHLAAMGQVMGGAIFTLADFSFAVAANTKEEHCVTTTSTINYVGMAKDEHLSAQCRCIKNGRKVCFYEVIITDGLGNIVAIVNTTGTHV